MSKAQNVRAPRPAQPGATPGVGLKPLRWPRAETVRRTLCALSCRVLRSLDFARDDIKKGDDGERKREGAEKRGRQRKGREGGRFFGFGVFCFAGFEWFGKNEVREREGPNKEGYSACR